MWKKVQGNYLPELLDIKQNENIVYIRNNVQEIIIEESTLYEYDESNISYDDWQSYTYSDVVTLLIRSKYLLDDELALQRQRDTKVEEFTTYNTYCEECKVKARQIKPQAQ